jgi:DNA-binding transcriptional LysR family regulator
MNLEDLRAIVAVAETGSLAKAATRLHITQPAVTRRIQRLESDLGAQLLDRDSKPARLTRTGTEVYGHALKIIQTGQELRASAAGGLATAPVRIGVSYVLADAMLGAAVDAVQRAAPGTKLVLTADRSPVLAKRVAERELDGAVLVTAVGRAVDGAFTVRDLGCERVFVVAPASYSGPCRTSIAGLVQARWVINPDGCGFRSQLERALVAAGGGIELAVEAWGVDLQLALVAQGLGFGLIPARVLSASPKRDLVKVLDTPDFRPTVAVQLITATAPGSAQKPLDTFADVIAREMQHPPAALRAR